MSGCHHDEAKGHDGPAERGRQFGNPGGDVADTRVELRVAQLMCSRLCHDLAGPVGAVNAGLELLREGAGPGDEALDLVARSAEQAGRRLAFLRLAFGLGTAAGGTMTVDAVRALTADLMAGGSIALDWPEPTKRVLPTAAGKLLLNLMLVGIACLPRGGRLVVHVAELAEGIGVAVTASGSGARLGDAQQAGLGAGGAGGTLSAQNIHAYLAARLAAGLGVAIEASDGDDGTVRLAVLVPGDANGGAPGADF